MRSDGLTLVDPCWTMAPVWSGIRAMEMKKRTPRRVLCGLVRRLASLWLHFQSLSCCSRQEPRPQSILRGFAFGQPDAVRRWSGLGYPAARASQSGERGLSPERGGERQSGQRGSDGWLHTEVQVASGANCVEARLGSALLRDSPPEVGSKEYVSLWRNTQHRGVDIGKMAFSVSFLRKVRGVSV